MGIRPGEAWGAPCSDAPDVTVHGGDDVLLAAVTAHPHGLIQFAPTPASDIARCLGLTTTHQLTGFAVPMDMLRIAIDGTERWAVNMLVLGTPPDGQTWRSRPINLGDGREPAVAVVVANGQFRRGIDLVPRGHPGDGRAEVHCYRLQARERRAMRTRLGSGTHVPHPRIETRSIRALSLHLPKPVPAEIDGTRLQISGEVIIEVVSNAYRLLL